MGRPPMPRKSKRPLPKTGEAWNPKKHQNRRKTAPVFAGVFRDTGQRVVSTTYKTTHFAGQEPARLGEFDRGPEGPAGRVIRSSHLTELAQKPVTDRWHLKIDERKKNYRYRKPRAR